MKALYGSILVKLDTKQKEKYNLTKDVKIEIERGYNFNLREDRASMGYIVEGGGLKEGDYCLLNYLALEQGYIIQDENILTKEEKKEGFKVLSVPKDMVFATSPDGKDWTPCKNFFLTLRIFKPYGGMILGVEPELVKEKLYVVKGFDEYDGKKTDLSGKVMCVTANSAYVIEWHNTENREEKLIRTMGRELLAIDHSMTDEVKKGNYLIGIETTDCKKL